MTSDFKITQVGTGDFDPAKLAPLLRQSQSEGYNLVLRLAEGWENKTNCFDKPGEAFFAAVHEGRWLAVGGRSVDPYLGDVRAVRVRHVYVLPGWRNCGIGTALMKRVLDIPQGVFDKVTLRTLNPVAGKFYERLGFEFVDGGDTVTHQLIL